MSEGQTAAIRLICTSLTALVGCGETLSKSDSALPAPQMGQDAGRSVDGGNADDVAAPDATSPPPPRDAGANDVGTVLGDAGIPHDAGTSTTVLLNALRLDQVQMKGTHNSYHIEPARPFSDSHRYTQPTLEDQLGQHNVRALELDVHHGRDGETEVYHIVVIDDETHCRLFTDCLAILRRWSEDHPGHSPIIVWVEVKEQTGGFPFEDLRVLDEEIEAELGTDRVFTPAKLRGNGTSVRQRLEQSGWPTIEALRDTFIFVLLNTDEVRDRYTENLAAVNERLLFARAVPSEMDAPWAAISKLGNCDETEVERAHERNIIVATNVCGIAESDEECQTQLDCALGLGIHMLHDDVPAPLPTRDYALVLPTESELLPNTRTASTP